VAQRDQQLIAFALDPVAADPKARVDDASSACDLEVPFVPGATKQARSGSLGHHATIKGDSAYDTARGAQRRSAVGAAVGKGVILAVDLVQTYLVPGESKQTDLAWGRRFLERHTQVRCGHACAGTGSAKNRAAFS
jgi:hypothetical protein